jgi:hypothetical protein
MTTISFAGNNGPNIDQVRWATPLRELVQPNVASGRMPFIGANNLVNFLGRLAAKELLFFHM